MLGTIIFLALIISGNCEKYYQGHEQKHQEQHRPSEPFPSSGKRPEIIDSGNSGLNRSPVYDIRDSPDRVVEIKTKRSSTTTQPHEYYKDCSFSFEVDVTTEFTCWLKNVTYIRWTGLRIKTDWVANDTLTLILTPDDDDQNQILTCEGAHAPDETKIYKNITITLDLSTPSNNTKKRRNYNPIYLKKGDELSINSSCQVLTRKPGTDCSVQYHYEPNSNNKIEYFDEDQNGTEFSCICYQKSQSRYSLNFQQIITVFERIKIRTIFYLGDETQKNATSKTTRNAAEQVLIVTSKSLEVNKGNKYDEARRSPATIVGYVFGAVAMVSVGVILGICFKSLLLRRAARNDDANQVIYTEIEEKPIAPPPPPRNNTPYAQIIGTLVPKQQVTENPYATIDNPYVTVR